MKRILTLFALLFFGSIGLAPAQAQAPVPVQAPAPKPAEKPKMQFMGAYDGGQPGVSIYKLFDPTDDVVCYVLTPEIAGRKQNEAGVWLYEGNSAGSISCLKVKVLVVPVGNQAPGPAQSAPTAAPKAPQINKNGMVQ
jgi:hypothetical protein